MKTQSITRFIEAQANGRYQTALDEIRNGRKQGHWIWYIFPQIKGLGFSEMSQFYGISSLAEAKEYLANDTLRQRLEEISGALLQHADKSAIDILGGIDAMKVRSCMTLFDLAEPQSIYNRVLYTFFDGKRCEKTLQMLGEQ